MRFGKNIYPWRRTTVMSVERMKELLKPLRIYVHNTKVWHNAFSEYFKIYSITDNSARVGFEDLDERKDKKVDWDFNEPILDIKLEDNKLIIKIVEFEGGYTVDLYYGDKLLIKDCRRHVGAEVEVEVQESSVISALGVVLGSLAFLGLICLASRKGLI